MSAVSESAGYRIYPIGRSASVHISILLSACLRIEIETQSEVIFISGISRLAAVWAVITVMPATEDMGQH